MRRRDTFYPLDTHPSHGRTSSRSLVCVHFLPWSHASNTGRQGHLSTGDFGSTRCAAHGRWQSQVWEREGHCFMRRFGVGLKQDTANGRGTASSLWNLTGRWEVGGDSGWTGVKLLLKSSHTQREPSNRACCCFFVIYSLPTTGSASETPAPFNLAA